MWTEWSVGYFGKAAKDFTNDERNKDGPTKQMYMRRLKVWKVQAYLVGNGHTIEAANEKIKQYYHTDKPTVLSGAIKWDQRNPELRFIPSGIRVRNGIHLNGNGPLGNDLGGILA
ncbi:hypothetical protein SEMRO_3896_G351770.1 [Seminavis robusta]|uniref:Uncharacterized protein n=1 Tax=Seminavis robusta TaxID=568900 RepID=A0A9N8F4J4_9STRA|nr:hypothetical protein SEMRO_3896_G351770.1 [Seminavis robusta]|eukprot:Sro3896_g351770.1 n/a (115) ;mRNA; r:774-1118